MARMIGAKRLEEMRSGKARPPEPKPQSATTTVAAGAQEEVFDLLGQQHEKPEEKFSKTWNPTVVKILVGIASLIVLAVLVWFGIFFFGTKGVADAVVGHAMR